MKSRKLYRKDLIEVCGGLYRNYDASIRIAVDGPRKVRLHFKGFFQDHVINGTSISDCLKQYNAA